MKLPDIPNGQRVTAALLNRIIRQANVGANLRGGRGLSWRNRAGGAELDIAAERLLDQEPAEQVLVVNQGTDAIAAFAPCGIIESLGKTDGDIQVQRALSVRLPKARDAGAFAIACDRIEPGAVGWAWISGTCLVKLYRWFSAELLDRADVCAGQPYALASIDGGLEILWSQRTDSGDLIVDREHFAVVRFSRWRPLRWFNSGTVDVPLGCPIASLVTATDGLVSGVLSARAPNSADVLSSCYINVGGTVKSGEFGKCTADIAVARAKASYNATASVGAEASQTAVSSSGRGLTVIARLGTYQGQQYDVVKQSGSVQTVTLQIIGGNTLSDGSTTGIKYASSAPTPLAVYDPAVDTSFPDGLGIAFLFLDNVSQGKVLVGHYSGNGSSLTTALWSTNRVLAASSPISLDVPSVPGTSLTIYVPLTR